MNKYNNFIIFAISIIVSTFVFAQGNGHNNHNDRSHYEDWPDSLETITVNGKVSVDSVNFMNYYGLETNNDDSTDYMLGFGPWWYEPESGAVRPSEGDNVTIKGGLHDAVVPAMLVVYEIDGLTWRDSIGAPPWSGGWIHNNANDTTWVFCPTDSLDHVGFPPTGMSGMMGNMGNMWPDSLYCQFEQIHIDSLPIPMNQDILEAYLCNFNNEFGGHFGMMGQFNGQNMQQGMMGFNHQIHFQFHYDETTLTETGMDESSIRLFYLDGQENWIEENNINIDFDNNIITLNNSNVAEFYAVQANTNKVGINDENSNNVPNRITIESAYPNPFNPLVKINYSISQNAIVLLQVFDINGKVVKEILNEYQNPGKYNINWDGINSDGQKATSGIYIVKIIADNNVKSKKITLLR